MRVLRGYSPRASLHRTPQERAEHCKALRELQADEEAWSEFVFLYDNLSILDGKSSSLLQFNSVMLAVMAIFYTFAQERVAQFFLLGGLALSIVSCLLCLFVVWVHWSGTGTLRDSTTHGIFLLEVRDRRTALYRVAWWLAVLSLVALISGVALLV